MHGKGAGWVVKGTKALPAQSGHGVITGGVLYRAIGLPSGSHCVCWMGLTRIFHQIAADDEPFAKKISIFMKHISKPNRVVRAYARVRANVEGLTASLHPRKLLACRRSSLTPLDARCGLAGFFNHA